MADFQKLSQFTPLLKPLETIPWYDEYAVRAQDSSVCLFINEKDKKLLEHMRDETPTIGKLNETHYKITNKISPLHIIQFLLNIHSKGFLENGEELIKLVPELKLRSPSVAKSITLFSVAGIKSRAGMIFPVLFFIEILALVFFNSGIIPFPSMYPFPDSIFYSFLIIPVSVLVLFNLKGLFSLIAFLFLGAKGKFVLMFRFGIPVLSMDKRSIISASPGRRRLNYIIGSLFFLFVMLVLSASFPFVPKQFSILLVELFWVSAILFIFDFYLLHDSLLLAIFEEFSHESGLDNKFKTFWKHGFATIESLFQKKFPKEELFFTVGILQLLWFFGYWFLLLYLLKNNFSELVHLSLEKGIYILIPWIVVAIAGTVFFLFTFIPFILRKTAGMTVSLFDLGSTLLKHEKNEFENTKDVSVDLKQIHLFSSVPENELKEIEEHVTLSKRNPNKLLIKEGEFGTTLLAIRKGKALVYTKGSRGEAVELAYLKEGDVFGERAILGDGKRTAHVKSLTPMELYIIPKEIFLEISESIGEKSRMSEIIMAANAVQSSPVFSDLPPQTILNFASKVTLEHFNAGNIILTKGDKSNRTFYIIKIGEAAVQGAGLDQTDIILKANDYFGEIALLNDSPRTATVISKTDTQIFAFSQDHFLELLFSNLGSLLKLETAGQRRLSEMMKAKQ